MKKYLKISNEWTSEQEIDWEQKEKTTQASEYSKKNKLVQSAFGYKVKSKGDSSMEQENKSVQQSSTVEIPSVVSVDRIPTGKSRPTPMEKAVTEKKELGIKEEATVTVEESFGKFLAGTYRMVRYTDLKVLLFNEQEVKITPARPFFVKLLTDRNGWTEDIAQKESKKHTWYLGRDLIRLLNK